MWVDKEDMSADDKVREFKSSNPKAEVHLRQAHVVSTPHPSITIPHSLHYSLIMMPPFQIQYSFAPAHNPSILRQKVIDACLMSPQPTSGLSLSRPLVDDQGVVIPRLTPSLTPPPVLLFTRRMETPASWPLSDDLGIETNTPVYVGSRSPSPEDKPWRPITITGRTPSPFTPVPPRPTPEKGIEAIPIASMGSNPGSPIATTPEYDYDRTSPPSPPAPKSDPSSSSSSLSSSTKSSQGSYFPAHTQKRCSEGCFDITYTLHHHNHSTDSKDDSDHWTVATLIKEPSKKNKRLWGYGLQQDKAKWEHLDNWEGWEEEDLTSLHAYFVDAVKGLTSALQCGR
jgi:hypothetical protein